MQPGYDPKFFSRLRGLEEESFWFQARNGLVSSVLRKHFPTAGRLLEIGCGTGIVLEALHRHFPDLELVGADLLPEGLELARQRLVATIELRQLDARELPYDREFDVVCAFDVLEHVEDDSAVLEGMFTATRPGGGIIVLVPQHPHLWSDFDLIAHHKRRYRRTDLLAKVRRVGFDVELATSFVASLLPVLALARSLPRRRGRPVDPYAGLVPPFGLNTLFRFLLEQERRLIERGITFPAGGSLLLVGRRPVSSLERGEPSPGP